MIAYVIIAKVKKLPINSAEQTTATVTKVKAISQAKPRLILPEAIGRFFLIG